jgi:hypothetical protein
MADPNITDKGQENQQAADTSAVQGEGDYKSARRFDEEERSFVEKGPVEQKAREAADALDGPEADDLEAARVASAKGESVKK